MPATVERQLVPFNETLMTWEQINEQAAALSIEAIEAMHPRPKAAPLPKMRRCANRTKSRKRRESVWLDKFGHSRTGRCCWCRKVLKKEDATLEHLTPLSNGGTNDRFNLDIACFKCNNGRNKKE